MNYIEEVKVYGGTLCTSGSVSFHSQVHSHYPISPLQPTLPGWSAAKLPPMEHFIKISGSTRIQLHTIRILRMDGNDGHIERRFCVNIYSAIEGSKYGLRAGGRWLAEIGVFVSPISSGHVSPTTGHQHNCAFLNNEFMRFA